MKTEPRQQSDYSAHQTEAARRVLVDLARIFLSYS